MRFTFSPDAKREGCNVQALVGRSLPDTMPAADLHFRTGQTDEAVALVKTFHYSHRAPVNVQLVGTFHTAGGLFGDFGPAVAAIFFSIPPIQWSEEVIELVRLVRREDCVVPLTRLISMACAGMKSKGHDLLVSFADPTHGHHGGVYQAASWNYHGRRRRRIDGVLWNGKFINQRQCQHLFNSSLSTEGVIERERARIGGQLLPHYDEGKHLYWRALSRSGEAKAARLELKRMAYPKPDKANERIED